MTNYLPLATAVITAVFAYQVLTRWQTGGRPTNLLIWGVGLIFYFIASLAAALYSIFGWQEAWGEINFKIWYFFRGRSGCAVDGAGDGFSTLAKPAAHDGSRVVFAVGSDRWWACRSDGAFSRRGRIRG